MVTRVEPGIHMGCDAAVDTALSTSALRRAHRALWSGAIAAIPTSPIHSLLRLAPCASGREHVGSRESPAARSRPLDHAVDRDVGRGTPEHALAGRDHPQHQLADRGGLAESGALCPRAPRARSPLACVRLPPDAADGTRVITASSANTVRVWPLWMYVDSLDDWRLLARCSPFALVNDDLRANPDPGRTCRQAPEAPRRGEMTP